MDILIRSPKAQDQAKLHVFFREVITDTFRKDGILDKQEDLEAEIEMKKEYLLQNRSGDKRARYFFLAEWNDDIIGTIEFGPSSDLIVACTNEKLKSVIELGTFYVHPLYQRRGIGNMLLKKIYHEMIKQGVKEFCLDSGYREAQKIWKRKFGEPDYLLKDYWGKESDHMIWRVDVSSVLE